MPISAIGTAFDPTGNQEDPAVVVLIHRQGIRRGMWRDYVPALQESRRVLTNDLFGHGGSGMPPFEPSLKLFSLQFEQRSTVNVRLLSMSQ